MNPDWSAIYAKLIEAWKAIPEDSTVREPLGDTLDMVWRRMTPAECQLTNAPGELK